MKNSNRAYLIFSAFLTAASISLVAATSVSADELEQNQELNQELECTTSSYGQTTCKAKQDGEQHQKIVTTDKVLGVSHKMVDTAVDPIALSGIAAMTLISGAGAVVAKRQ